MVCEQLSVVNSISDFLVYPTGCDYYFYLKILLTIEFIIGWGLYKIEKQTIPGGGDLISCFGVSSIAITILATIGTMIKNTSNIPMISTNVLLIIIALAVPVLLIWIFKD